MCQAAGGGESRGNMNWQSASKAVCSFLDTLAAVIVWGNSAVLASCMHALSPSIVACLPFCRNHTLSLIIRFQNSAKVILSLFIAIDPIIILMLTLLRTENKHCINAGIPFHLCWLL